MNELHAEFGDNILAGTGHRPDKLSGYSKHAQGFVTGVCLEFLRTIRPTAVISGMALGFDQALAQAAVNLKLPLIAAIPFKGQESRWYYKDQQQFQKLLDKAAKVVYVCEGGYAAYKMQARNQWMIDHCDVLLALWNGSAGGTGNCIKAAASTRPDLHIVNCWDYYFDLKDSTSNKKE